MMYPIRARRRLSQTIYEIYCIFSIILMIGLYIGGTAMMYHAIQIESVTHGVLSVAMFGAALITTIEIFS